jgi:hypothetical protein
LCDLVDVVDHDTFTGRRGLAKLDHSCRVGLQHRDRVDTDAGMRVSRAVLRVLADHVRELRTESDSDQGRRVERHSDGCVRINDDNYLVRLHSENASRLDGSKTLLPNDVRQICQTGPHGRT